ncbi:MAG: N-acetylglucosamine-6-phosphate deacetylase [Legionella sp.]|nr:N-acetylglucosamine-6-phosphate deacetylase [Legionella sp.]
MLIKNIYVYPTKELQNVYVTDEGRVKILNSGEELPDVLNSINAKGRYTLMPGMLDSHVHGQGGVDFADVGALADDEGLPIIAEALGKTGLSYAMATLVSLPLETLENSLKKINDYVQNQEENQMPGYTRIIGVHLEGPFIAPNCKGAHALNALQDSISLEQFKQIIAAAPAIKEWKITLAPDLPGAIDFIQEVKTLEAEGISVKVFIGHSNPDKATITKAIDAGAAGFTHLGNACAETCCRETRALEIADAKSNLVQWVLENPEYCPAGVEIITDGVHVSPSFVALLKRTLGEKQVLVTDALGPSGLSNGVYKLGSLAICLDEGSFYLADEAGNILMKEGTLPDGQKGKVKSLAGSAAPLSRCVQNYCEWTALADTTDPMDAIYAATVTNPRQSSLSPAAIARLPDDRNFVVFDKKGRLMMSLCNGKLIEHQPLLLKAGVHVYGLLANSSVDEKAEPSTPLLATIL